MQLIDYMREIEVSNTPEAVYLALTEEFYKWWTAASHPFKAVGDSATFKFDTTYWTMRATKLEPGKCVELECIDAHHRHEGLPESIREEWKGTTLKWNIFRRGDKTRISFVHNGLVPSLNCYEICETGWNYYFVNCLKEYLDKEENRDFSRLKRPVYEMPEFVELALKEKGLIDEYKKRPAYQQNDYISWITRAKRQETKQKRLNQMLAELKKGGIYMKMKHPASKK